MIKAWTEEAWEDFEYWTTQDRKVLKRILQLLKDIDRNSYEGIGKPERLSGDLSSYWSRRIDDALKGVDFACVPLKIITDDAEYLDDGTLDTVGMARTLRTYKGKTSTSCPNVSDWLAAYEGADEVYAITITGTLSGSYNAAQLAAEEYQQENPGKRVFVLDSLSTGPEQYLLEIGRASCRERV